MSGWTEEAIVAAAAAWRWVPPDAHQVLTPEYQLVRYPEHYLTNRVGVLWSRSERPVGELIEEVGQYVRVWGHSEVHWQVRAATRPQGTEAEFLRRGAPLTETAQVLAYDLTRGLPELAEPPGVTSQVVGDEGSVRAGQVVDREVWGKPEAATDAEIELALAETQRDLADWSSFRVVSYLNGEPASFGGCTLVDGVARLWGAGTRQALRGHGAYRAVLARRLAVAKEHGATLALVKGRVETSAPILRRAGFLPYGEQRTYLVTI